MKTLYFIIILSLFAIESTSSQTFCNTSGNVPNFLATIPSSSLLPPANTYQIRVYAHIVRTSGGAGGMSQTELNTAMSVLNQDFQPLGICFTLVGQDFINNDSYYNGGINQSIFSINATPNSIDMYFLPNTCPSPGGLANGIVSKAFVVGGTWTNNPPNVIVNTSHIVSHEMGHCLGLYHTHHGTVNEGTPGECPELVNGSNSSTCGDFILDTPADPFIGFNVNSSCVWLGTGTDTNGQAYNPDEHIIMAYTSPACMEYLTDGEGQRMMQAIANSSILQQVAVANGCCVNDLVINTNVLSGQDNQQATNSITATNTISSGASGIYHAGAYLVFKPSFNSKIGSKLHAYIEGCNGLFVARQVVEEELDIENPIEVKNQIMVAPNPNNGIFNVSIEKKSDGIVEISDLYGSTIFKFNFKDQNEFELNMQEKPKGIYVVKVFTDTATLIGKIIKN